MVPAPSAKGDAPRAFLIASEVATLLRCSLRTVHELTRSRTIPHRRLAGIRRCLFLEHELQLWLDGAALETIELAGGGRIVRVSKQSST